jgi:hypothetical protein
MRLRPALAFAAAASLGALAGCVVINKDHCAYAKTECAEGLVCSACAVDNNGCVAPASVQDEMCLVREGTSTGGTVSTTSDPSATDPTTTTLTTSTSTSDSTSSSVTTEPTTVTGTDTSDTTGTSSTTDMIECLGEVVTEMCAGDTPYCVDMMCVGCDKLSSCKEFEPDKPACEVSSGRCVECISNDDCIDVDQPACDGETATCVPCTEHSQCPETACNLETGQCFPTDSVLYVYNEVNTCSEKADYGLTEAKPLCTLNAALKRAVVGKPLTIKIKPSVKSQSLPAGLPAGAFVVAIVPQDALVPSLLMAAKDFPVLSLASGNKVFMLKVAIQSSIGVTGSAVECADASLWLDRQKIFSNDVAIHADNCLLRLRRTVIFSNTGGGLDVEGSDPLKANVSLENSYLTENNGSSFGGLRLAGAASAKILYSTVALNNGAAAPIDCLPGWSGKLELRNSAIVGAGAHFGAGCNKPVPVTCFESDVSDKNTLKRTTFLGFGEGIFTALEGGVLEGKAVWKKGDPVSDFNDTARPTTENAADYAGADRPVM